ncbi:lecithin-cholesterol acyltransferase-like 1 [Oryza glaberrima]|uniref:lecithin-cholesterol acyltransferase-like 1 n=1 Tax=Oryza glaberrima TaxID=4538 RepID=UPI00224C4FF0|nr:lecithin-cholesterol acyltransferase-like 1 [Oryza glaberrima]
MCPVLLALMCPVVNGSALLPLHDAAVDLHPIMLLPGNGCSQLDAELTEHYEPSPWAPLRVVYDRAVTDYRNIARVWTHVVSFGTTRGFGSDDDPSDPESLRVSQQAEALGRISYKEGENLFGAPYDSRYVAAPPGMPAMAFAACTADLRCLVEHASRKNGGKPVILVTHSKGAHGIVVAMQSLAASAYAAPGSLARTERSYGTVFAALPSPNVFGGAPLVVTRRRNYSAHNISEFLVVVGFSGEEVKLYRTRVLPVNSGLRAPCVPMTAVYGAGVPTPEQLVYWDGDFSKAPEVVYGNGDGAVNLVSVLAWNTVVGHDLEQGFFKAVKGFGQSRLLIF